MNFPEDEEYNDLRDNLTEEEFFGQDPTADFHYWSRLPYWKAEECVALSFGYDPRKIKAQCAQWPDHPFLRLYSERRELVIRAQETGSLDDKIPPVRFLQWMETNGITNTHIPTLALDHTILSNPTKKNPDDHFNEKERTSLYKIILLMAIDGYGFRPSNTRTEIPRIVANAGEHHSINISDDTVRKFLRAAVSEIGDPFASGDVESESKAKPKSTPRPISASGKPKSAKP